MSRFGFCVSTLLLVLAAAHAQTGTITGFVREMPDLTPLAGANVTLVQGEAPIGSFVTGSTGEFAFREVKPGAYTLQASKAGYFFGVSAQPPFKTVGALNVDASEGRFPQAVNLILFAPATLSGRVEDEQGNPVPGFEVSIRTAAGFVSSLRVTTDGEGRFTTPPLVAGRYLAHVAANVKQKVLPSFTEEDAAAIDYDHEPSYWPGGTSRAAAALPANLASGASVDLGAIRPRRVPYYRARVRVGDEECRNEFFIAVTPVVEAVGEPVSFVPMQPVPCAPEYLVTGLAAGRYRVRMTNEAGAARWARADFDVGSDARPVEMRFQFAVSISGRLVLGEGVKEWPEVRNARVGLGPDETNLGDVRTVRVEEDHRFVLPNLFAVPSRVQSPLLPAPYYVSEIRYGGQPVPDGRIIPSPGAELDLVIDDRAGTISGTYTGGDGRPFTMMLYRVRDGRPEPVAAARASVERLSSTSGRFRFPNVPPGEYKVLAVNLMALESPDMQRILAEGQLVRVKRGENTDVSLSIR